MPINYEKMSQLRKAHGMTLEVLSSLSGVPISTLRKISSSATVNPNIDTMVAIAHALDCTLDDLTCMEQAPVEEDKNRLLSIYDSLSEENRYSLISYAKFLASQHSQKAGYSNSLGERIKELRIVNNDSQADLAEKLEMSRSYISMLECGNREPQLSELQTIAEIYNVDMNYLCGK